MADQKISDLTEVTSLLVTDQFELARSGVSNRITAANLVAASTQRRTAGVVVSDPLGDVLTAAAGKAYILIPLLVDLADLIDAVISVSTVATSGLTTVQLRRNRAGVDADMLSTPLTIDVGESTSLSAATPAVIDTANDDVQVGDFIYIDVDVAGNDAKGLYCQLTFSV